MRPTKVKCQNEMCEWFGQERSVVMLRPVSDGLYDDGLYDVRRIVCECGCAVWLMEPVWEQLRAIRAAV